MDLKEDIQRALCEVSVDLYDKVISNQTGHLSNFFMSPLSIYAALAMTLAGAKGETEQEMLKTLRITETIQKGDLHASIGATMLDYFKIVGKVDLSLANRLFALKNMKILDSFKKTLQKKYSADTENLSTLSSNDAKRVHINKWVAENTRDKIKELLSEGMVTDDISICLVNALYFKGVWENPFEKEQTKEAPFHLLDGTKIQLKMMFEVLKISHSMMEDLDAEAVWLPFGGSQWEMLVVLPYKQNGLPDLLDKLRQPGCLEKILTEERSFPQKVKLHLPRFKLSETAALNVKQLLEQCGMKALFQPSKADLSGISDMEKLFVSDVVHKAILEVDEEGATAAAATAMMMCSLSAPRPIPTVRVDHPFFVALICDRDVPVFMGHVVKPEGH